jgi:predicted Fe-Mo cluster-binding NifX family protein
MAGVISDCDAVIAGGMGRGAYEALQARGIRPIITDLLDVREAALQCAQGTLPNLTERLH